MADTTAPPPGQAFLVYSSSIYSDMGNYRDFGDTKKVPGLPQDKLAALVRASRAYETDSKTLERLLDGCLARLYTLNDSVAQLGLGDKVTGADEGEVVVEVEVEVEVEMKGRCAVGVKAECHDGRLCWRRDRGLGCGAVEPLETSVGSGKKWFNWARDKTCSIVLC